MGQACNPPDESLSQPPPEPLYQRYDPNVVISCFTHAVSWFLCRSGFVEQEMVDHIVKYDDKYEDDHDNYSRCYLTYAVGQEYKGKEKNPRKLGGVVVKGNTEDIKGWGPGVFVPAETNTDLEALDTMIRGLAKIADEDKGKYSDILETLAKHVTEDA